LWGANAGSAETCIINYGTGSPGKASGVWYTWYGCSTTVPSKGTGHYHQDAHSKGTGATDITLPPFVDVTNHNYALTTSYAGNSLTAKSWYIPEMGLDRNNAPRVSWDVGAYEYVQGGDTTPPAAPTGLAVY